MREITALALLLSMSATPVAGEALDLSDPRTLVDAYVRTVGDIAGNETFMYANVVVMSMVPGEKGRKLFGLEVIGVSRFFPIEGGYQRLHREVGLYTDLASGTVLSAWENPYLNRAVDVIHIQNDPVNFTYTVEQQSTPYRIIYDDFGSTIAFHREIQLRYPSALTRSEYPLHSAGDWYEAAELFNSFANRAELEDSNRSSVSEVGSWSRVGPWLPWMEMADGPGHLLYHGRSSKLMGGIADIPPRLRAYIEEHMPEYLHAPETLKAPNQTSWTYFKQVLDQRRAQDANNE